MGAAPEARQLALWKSRRYTMTDVESAQWDRADSCDRRKMLYAIGERLADETKEGEACCVQFYHANGELLGKTVYHQPAYRPTAPIRLAK